jgi:hypothetical protein
MLQTPPDSEATPLFINDFCPYMSYIEDTAKVYLLKGGHGGRQSSTQAQKHMCASKSTKSGGYSVCVHSAIM